MTDLQVELERMRAAFDDVRRDRDLLKSHVSSMEKLVQQQVGKAVQRPALPPRPTSAPPTRPRSAGDSRQPSGAEQQGRSSGSVTARGRLSKEEQQDMMRRLYGKYWKMHPENKGSGVEQRKKKLEETERRERSKARETVKVVKKSREEIEKACDNMFKRAMERKQRLGQQMQKKREEQIPTHKKSTASDYARAMHFQRLSMPNRPTVKASSASQSSVGGKASPRKAWMAGQRREEAYKVWAAGRTVGLDLPRTAVH
jgi:hypothetical protein